MYIHGDCQIPNMYNKTYVDTVVADIYDDTYIKTEIGSLISNIGLSNHNILNRNWLIVFKYRFQQLLY